MATRADSDSPTLLPAARSSDPPGSLAAILGRARLQVLRATVLIALLIAIGNLIGSIAGFTPSGTVTGPATVLAAAWCVLWALAAAFPRITARCFVRWQVTGLALALANTATVALTGGVDSAVLSVCMYVGWIASVVVRPRPAMAMSVMIAISVFAGYLLAGDALSDIVSGSDPYTTIANAVLPIVTGSIGVLLASVTNRMFSALPEVLHGLRHGEPATTPGLTALLSGRPVLALPAAPPNVSDADVGAPLTPTERQVVALLADGYRAKQIAQLRGVALSTVRSQIKSAKKKTGARTLDELVAVTWDANQ